MLPDTPRPSDTDIVQRARDELADWREGTTPGPWNDHGNYITAPSWIVASTTPRDTQLIVATAGNAELLDAIDRLLAEALDTEPGGRDMQAGWESGVRHSAAVLAAAIIAAADRMA